MIDVGAPMDDGTSALANLALRLPGFDQDISIQDLSQGAQEFVNFKKLPIEIRLNIWRFCSPPGRMVYLRQQKYLKVEASKYQERRPGLYRTSQRYTPPPVTMFINKERRQETLRYYRIVQ